MSGWRLGFAVVGRADRRRDRQDDQHVAVVRAAARPARRARRRSSTTPPSATSRCSVPREGRAAGRRAATDRRRSRSLMPAGDVLRLPERRADLQPAGHHVARAGDVPARRRRRHVRRRLPGRRVLRRGGRRASCASAAPSPTSGCSRRSTSSRRPSRAPIASRQYLETQPEFRLKAPYPTGKRGGQESLALSSRLFPFRMIFLQAVRRLRSAIRCVVPCPPGAA